MDTHRCTVLLVVLLGGLLLSACGASRHLEFSPANDEPRLYEVKAPMDIQRLSAQAPTNNDVNFLMALKQSRNIEDARFIDINPALVKAGTGRLLVPLPNGDIVKFQQRNVHEERGDVVFWFGDIVSDRKQRYPSPNEAEVDPVSRMMLVRQGRRLSGEIHLLGQHYRIENAGAGRHVLLKLGAESSLECDPIDVSGGGDFRKPVTGSQPKARSTIRVMFVSTDDARRLDPSLESKILSNLTMASIDFRNSNVDVEFEYAGHFALDFSESGFGKDMDKVLYELSEPDTSAGKKVAAQREVMRADLVITLVGFGGFAGKSMVGGAKEAAFGLINPLHESYFLTHQLGHLMGGTHTWRPGSPQPGEPVYRFAHELFVNGVKYHTIMGRFDCPYNNCDHYDIFQFSDPSETFASVPLGDEEHSNNVRLFNERRDEVSRFYP